MHSSVPIFWGQSYQPVAQTPQLFQAYAQAKQQHAGKQTIIL